MTSRADDAGREGDNIDRCVRSAASRNDFFQIDPD